jgi:hypothetical protein
MTVDLDLPRDPLEEHIKEDHKWIASLCEAAGVEKMKKKYKWEHSTTSSEDEYKNYHDDVVPVSDTRSFAERLRDKIESLRQQRIGKRKSEDATTSDDPPAKRMKNNREKKKKSKRKDLENGKQKNKSNKKGRLKEETPNGLNGISHLDDEDGVEYPVDYNESDSDADNERGEILQIEDSDESFEDDVKMKLFGVKPQTASPSSIISPELEEDIKFGTFDFSSGRPLPMYLTSQLPQKKKRSKKVTPFLLKQVENKQQILADKSEEGKKKAEKIRWDTIMDRAQGVKVKDDPKLIRKTLKKMKKKKEKSAKEWAKRKEDLEQRILERQKRREENIKSKKEQRKERKINKRLGIKAKSPKPNAKSKPKAEGNKAKRRPGFEGRKNNFINK